MRTRIGLSRCVGACASFTMRSLPQRSQVMRRNHDGKARIGCSIASCGVGSGLVAVAAAVPRQRGHGPVWRLGGARLARRLRPARSPASTTADRGCAEIPCRRLDSAACGWVVSGASCLLGHPAHDLAPQGVGGIAAPLVLLRRLRQQVGRQDPLGLPPDGDDRLLAVVVGRRQRG